MKRMLAVVGLTLVLAAAPAVAQTRVSGSIVIGTPGVAGYVVLGRPYDTPYYYVYREPVVVIERPWYVEPRLIIVRRHYRHFRHYRSW